MKEMKRWMVAKMEWILTFLLSENKDCGNQALCYVEEMNRVSVWFESCSDSFTNVVRALN